MAAVSQRRAGAALSYVSLVVNAAVSFVYVPLLLGFLGTDDYGVYELIGSFIAYLSVMDAGMCVTLSRFYVQSLVRGDEGETANLLAMGAAIYGAIAVVAVLVGAGCYALLGPLFGGSFTPSELDLARRMMLLVIVNCAVVLPGNWFLAVINARERFVFARSLAIAKYLLQVATVVAVLLLGAGALGVVAAQVACNALGVAAYAVYVARRLPVRVSLVRWDWRLAGSLFAFSGFVLLNMVFDQVFWKTGQVVLGAVGGAASVAVYGVACKVVTAGFMQVSTGVTGVFLPRLAALEASGDPGRETDTLFRRIGRIQGLLVWGVLGGFVALGRPFVELWAGPDFALAYPVVVVLMVGLSVALVQNLGISVLQAKNRMGFRAAVYTALAVLDVLLSIPAGRAWGVMGVAWVAAVLLFLGTGPVMNVYYRRAIGLDIPAFWRSVLPTVVPAAMATAALMLLEALVRPVWSWPALLVGVAVYLVVYGAVAWARILNGYERGLVRSAIEGMRGKVARCRRR